MDFLRLLLRPAAPRNQPPLDDRLHELLSDHILTGDAGAAAAFHPEYLRTWTTTYERSALHWACSRNHTAMISLLLRSGADANHKVSRALPAPAPALTADRAPRRTCSGRRRSTSSSRAAAT